MILRSFFKVLILRRVLSESIEPINSREIVKNKKKHDTNVILYNYK